MKYPSKLWIVFIWVWSFVNSKEFLLIPNAGNIEKATGLCESLSMQTSRISADLDWTKLLRLMNHTESSEIVIDLMKRSPFVLCPSGSCPEAKISMDVVRFIYGNIPFNWSFPMNHIEMNDCSSMCLALTNQGVVVDEPCTVTKKKLVRLPNKYTFNDSLAACSAANMVLNRPKTMDDINQLFSLYNYTSNNSAWIDMSKKISFTSTSTSTSSQTGFKWVHVNPNPCTTFNASNLPAYLQYSDGSNVTFLLANNSYEFGDCSANCIFVANKIGDDQCSHPHTTYCETYYEVDPTLRTFSNSVNFCREKNGTIAVPFTSTSWNLMTSQMKSFNLSSIWIASTKQQAFQTCTQYTCNVISNAQNLSAQLAFFDLTAIPYALYTSWLSILHCNESHFRLRSTGQIVDSALFDTVNVSCQDGNLTFINENRSAAEARAQCQGMSLQLFAWHNAIDRQKSVQILQNNGYEQSFTDFRKVRPFVVCPGNVSCPVAGSLSYVHQFLTNFSAPLDSLPADVWGNLSFNQCTHNCLTVSVSGRIEDANCQHGQAALLCKRHEKSYFPLNGLHTFDETTGLCARENARMVRPESVGELLHLSQIQINNNTFWIDLLKKENFVVLPQEDAFNVCPNYLPSQLDELFRYSNQWKISFSLITNGSRFELDSCDQLCITLGRGVHTDQPCQSLFEGYCENWLVFVGSNIPFNSTLSLCNALNASVLTLDDYLANTILIQSQMNLQNISEIWLGSQKLQPFETCHQHACEIVNASEVVQGRLVHGNGLPVLEEAVDPQTTSITTCQEMCFRFNKDGKLFDADCQEAAPFFCQGKVKLNFLLIFLHISRR